MIPDRMGTQVNCDSFPLLARIISIAVVVVMGKEKLMNPYVGSHSFILEVAHITYTPISLARTYRLNPPEFRRQGCVICFFSKGRTVHGGGQNMSE